MIKAKCYNKGKELEEGRKVFKEILKKVKKITSKNFDFKQEFKTIKALCEVVEYVYAFNDFQASCMAYMYTMPRILDLIKYISLFMENKIVVERGSPNYEIDKWIVLKGEETKARLEDGSNKQYTRIEYLYSYLKDRQMAIAARYFIHWNIMYLEKEKFNKAYPARERVLKSAVWWTNQLLLGKFKLRMPDSGEEFNFIPKKIIFSTMPSSGKSFLCNTTNEMFSELGAIINKRGGVLRVSNEQSNILRQSNQTMNLIRNLLIFDIYPENKEFIKNGKYDPFGKSSEEEWGIKGCEYTPNTSIFKTRDSAINSVRCELGMFDDPSRGMQESNNVQIHQKICTLFNGDFLDRFESQDDISILLTGTMFNPFDVFSTEIQKALANGYKKDTRFLNTFISNDKETVVIVNDCEDEYGDSAFPEFISTKALHAKRDSLPEYDYHCIWRQKPIPAEGLIFSRELLRFFDELPSELTSYAFATIDPTRRKASDFFAMPILKRHLTTGDYYLVDIIYERKGSMALMDNIIKKIIQNRIIKIYYEENINDTLGTTISEKLEKKGIKSCKLLPIYNTVNKMQRIADMEGDIKAHIVFPSEKFAPSKSTLGFAIHQLTQYNGEKSEHDDMPDSLAMFAEKFIVYKEKQNIIKTTKNLPF